MFGVRNTETGEVITRRDTQKAAVRAALYIAPARAVTCEVVDPAGRTVGLVEYTPTPGG